MRMRQGWRDERTGSDAIVSSPIPGYSYSGLGITEYPLKHSDRIPFISLSWKGIMSRLRKRTLNIDVIYLW